LPSYMGNLAAVGAPRPTWQELSPALMTHSTVYVDSEVSANSESGDVVLSGAQVYAEIGDVINGSKSALKQRRTIFKSLGNSTPTLLSSVHCLKNDAIDPDSGIAVEDAVSARLVFDANRSAI